MHFIFYIHFTTDVKVASIYILARVHFKFRELKATGNGYAFLSLPQSHRLTDTHTLTHTVTVTVTDSVECQCVSVSLTRLQQSRISRAERLFNYDVIDSHAVGCMEVLDMER